MGSQKTLGVETIGPELGFNSFGFVLDTVGAQDNTNKIQGLVEASF